MTSSKKHDNYNVVHCVDHYKFCIDQVNIRDSSKTSKSKNFKQVFGTLKQLQIRNYPLQSCRSHLELKLYCRPC